MVSEDRFGVKSMDHLMLGRIFIKGFVYHFCQCALCIYLYLLEGANASNSIKTNFHFTAKRLSQYCAHFGPPFRNGQWRCSSAGAMMVKKQSTHVNSKLKFIIKLLQMFLLNGNLVVLFNLKLVTLVTLLQQKQQLCKIFGFSGVYDGPLAFQRV